MAAAREEQAVGSPLSPSGKHYRDDWDLTQLFDEDECRDFLGRTGDKVVNSYAFVIGMEETYSCIWDRYGSHGSPDAISLLHEILEEEDVVGAGLGLETDIWRPWKRAFRLRNINPHALWLPHVGTRVLPPATPPEIRRIRAHNFLMNKSASTSVSDQQQLANDSSSTSNDQKAASPPRLDGTDGARADIPAYAHQRYRTYFQLEDSQAESPAPASNNQSSTEEVKRLSSIISRRPTISSVSSIHDVRPRSAQIETPTLDPAVAQAWLALTATQPPTPAQADEEGEQIQTLQPLRYNPGLIEEHTDQVTTLQPLRYNPGPVEQVEDQVQTLQPLQYIPGSQHTEQIHASQPAARQENDTIGSLRLSSPAREPHSEVVAKAHRSLELPEVVRDPETVTAEIQYAHRNATLLAGEIRTPVTPRNRVQKSIDVEESVITVQPAAQPAQREKRQSFRSRFSALFGVGEKKKRAGLPDSCGFIINSKPSALRFSNKKVPSTNIRVRPCQMPIAIYDGACSPRSSFSSSHLNKPLPLSPGQRASSALSRAHSTSSSPMRRMEYNPPLTASTTDTQSSTASRKDHFRQIAKDLLQINMIPAPRLPMYEDGSTSPAARLEPRKYEPSQPSPGYYNSIALSNPFTDKPVFVSQSFSKKHDEIEQGYNVSEAGEVPPMPSLPASHSEPNFNFNISPAHEYYGTMPSRQESPALHTSERSYPPQHEFTASSRTGSSSSPDHGSSVTDERRGRSRTRPQTPHTDEGSPDKRKQSKPPKRSQSPIKRLLGMGKSAPSKDTSTGIPGNVDPTPGGSAKRSLKDWSYKIKHGFLAPDNLEQERESHMEEYDASKSVPKKQPPSTFPISLDPSYQARLQADLELMILVTANRFLMREAQAGRIPRFSIDKFRRNWEANNMPQVIEYQFDMATQRAMIMENIKTVEFCGQVAENPLTLAAALHSWNSMIYEMSIRTFCVGDSVIRKWLNDGQRILEMLGAPYVTFSMFDKMSTKALLVINHRQRIARAQDASEASDIQNDVNSSRHTRNFSDSSYVFRSQGHKRSVSNDSYVHGLYGSMAAQLEALDPLPSQNASNAQARHAGPPKAVIAEPKPQQWPVVVPTAVLGSRSYEHTQTLPRDAYEESRGGRLGLMRNATPAVANNTFSRQRPSRAGIREV